MLLHKKMGINLFIEEKDSIDNYLIDDFKVHRNNSGIEFYFKPTKTENKIRKILDIKFNKARPLEIALVDAERYIKKTERGRFRFNKKDLIEIIKELKGKKITELNKEAKKSFETEKTDYYYRIMLVDKSGRNYSIKLRFDQPFESIIEYSYRINNKPKLMELKVKTEVK